MKSLSKFQLIVLTFFVVALLAGVLTLALSRTSTNEDKLTRIAVWGTMPEGQFQVMIGAAPNGTSIINASYQYKSPETIYRDVLEAIAAGTSPDALVLSQDELYQFRGKLVTVPYESYSERLYKDTFVEGAEAFVSEQGIDAFPFAVDPLVMYWNRDIFNSVGIQRPPQYWDEIPSFVQTFTKKDATFNILRSAIALGETSNVDHSKEILSALIYQAGGRVTLHTDSGAVVASLSESFNNPRNPALSAVDFYTQFSNPQKLTYTWSRTLPHSKDFFVSGDLALYVGYASEINEIRAKNPNLNFDVTSIPQARGVLVPTTYGSYWTYAVLRSAPRSTSALSNIGIVTGAQTGQLLVNATTLLPVRRDLLSVSQSRADKIVFYDAARKSRTWIDPNGVESDRIFTEMISMVTSGRMTSFEAVGRATNQLANLLK